MMSIKPYLLTLLTCLLPTTLLAAQVLDDTQQLVTLVHPAQRIISLAPDLTETLFALGAQKSLVGVINGSNYPLAAQKIQKVGDYHALDLEAIVALHPDLIVAWGESHARQLALLKQLGFPVYISRSQHLLDIPTTIERLGCLTGQEITAHRLAHRFLADYAQLSLRYKRPHPITVFYQITTHPLMTVNSQSWINDAINLCGGRNIFAEDGKAPFKQTVLTVSLESVIKANPQVIIGETSPWQLWPSLAAKKHHHFVINPDIIERASPRILEGVQIMCQNLASIPSSSEV